MLNGTIPKNKKRRRKILHNKQRHGRKDEERCPKEICLEKRGVFILQKKGALQSPRAITPHNINDDKIT